MHNWRITVVGKARFLLRLTQRGCSGWWGTGRQRKGDGAGWGATEERAGAAFRRGNQKRRAMRSG